MVRQTHDAAQALVAALADAKFDMTNVSMVGKGALSAGHPHGFFKLGDRVKEWAGSGSLWGAGWGLMLGAAIFVMPPIGVIVAAGPFVAALLAIVEGAAVVGGVSAVAAALTTLGVDPKQAAKHDADLQADRFLVVVNGCAAEIARAKAIADASQS